MTYQHAYYLCLAAFGVFTLASVYEYLQLQPPMPALVVDEPEQILPGTIVGREYVIDFHVHNRGSRMLRVVGAEYT